MYIELLYQDDYYTLNGLPLTAGPSRVLIDYSASFEHGRATPGAQQLALAICLELFGHQAALQLHRDLAQLVAQCADCELLDVSTFAVRAQFFRIPLPTIYENNENGLFPGLGWPIGLSAA